jgi:hypothetical protein
MINNQQTNSYINLLSDHLFWDIDKNKLDIEKSKKTIVQRTLDYGLIKDWKILVQVYGIEEIARTAINLRDLDIKSASFISLLSHTPLEKFACYTSKQSMPQHMNF